MLDFTTAVREQIPLRMALIGANGSGKTLGALRVADALGGIVAVIDTERGRAKLYADRFDFLHAELHDHSPEGFRDAVRQAGDLADTVIVDSFSHEWLDVLTQADKFGDWKTLTPRHRECIEAMLSIPANLIVTMRAKVKYGVEEVEVPGRDKPRQVISRLGVGPVQREGIEYEFDVLAYLDTDHVATFSNRCDPLVGESREVDEATIEIITTWLAEGDPPPPPPPFDPGHALLPAAEQFAKRNALKLIAEALAASVPDVNWPATINGLVSDVYGAPDVKRLPRDETFAEFTRRLANVTANLGLLGDLVSDDQIQATFAWGFEGHVLNIEHNPKPDPDPEPAPEDPPADAPPAGIDGDVEEEMLRSMEADAMAAADLDSIPFGEED